MNSVQSRWRGVADWGGPAAVLVAAAAIAKLTPYWYVLFPELGALSYELFRHPRGRWAQNPWMVVLTPTATATVGVGLGIWWGSSLVAILGTVLIAVVILTGFRSAITPAISAGVLAVVLGIRQWQYPAAIMAGALILIGLHRGYGWLLRDRGDSPADAAVDRLRPVWRWKSTAWILVFTAVAALLAQETGWRFVLFPPLLVIAWEALTNPLCPWSDAYRWVPLVGLMTAGWGWIIESIGGLTIPSVLVTVLGAIGIIRLLKVHLPPAIAVAILPFIIPHPSWRYPISVAIGLSLFACSQWMWLNWGKRIRINPAS